MEISQEMTDTCKLHFFKEPVETVAKTFGHWNILISTPNYEHPVFNLLFDSSMLKSYASALCKPIMHLVNMSINQCLFPDAWKKL